LHKWGMHCPWLGRMESLYKQMFVIAWSGSLHSPSNFHYSHFNSVFLVFLACQSFGECVCSLFRVSATFGLDNSVLDQVSDPMPLCGYVFGSLMELQVLRHRNCSHVVPSYLYRFALWKSQLLTQAPQPASLSSSFRKCDIFCLCRRQGNHCLFFQVPSYRTACC
jgi:hypothetical protein